MTMSDLVKQINPIVCGKNNKFYVGKSNPLLLTHFTHYTYFTHFTHFMNQLAATWAQAHGPWAHVAASWFIR